MPIQKVSQLPSHDTKPIPGYNLEKHLEFVQGAIQRMASNCFKLKGWCITILVGAMTFTDKIESIAVAAMIPAVVIFFAAMDTYYLRLERGFRVLYEQIIGGQYRNFTMTPQPVSGRVFASFSVGGFYFFLFAFTFAVLVTKMYASH